jgi:hypothetical protein
LITRPKIKPNPIDASFRQLIAPRLRPTGRHRLVG